MEEKKVLESKGFDGEVFIDFDGQGNTATAYEKIVVKDEVYTAKFLSFELQHTKKYGEVGTEPTIVGKVEVNEGQGAIPFFIKPKVTKAYNEKVSNSKLYDLFEKAGVLEEAKERKTELSTFTGLLMFVDEKFKGRSIKFLTKTRKVGTPDAYSSVDRVLEFLPVDSVKSEEVSP